MKIETLRDVLIRDLETFYTAEVQLARELPRMARAASDGELAAILDDYVVRTRDHTEWARMALRRLGATPPAGRSGGAPELNSPDRKAKTFPPEIRDFLITGIAQRLKDYEVSADRMMKNYTQMIDEAEVAALLARSLEAERAAERRLAGAAWKIAGEDTD